MVRLIVTFAVGAATRQRSVLSPWEKTSTRYLRTRHPGRNERSIALRSPSTTERGKSSERPVSGSARESVFLSIATLAPSCRDREERRRQSKRYDNPSLPRSPVFAGLSGRNRHVVDIRPQIAEHPSQSTITVNDEKKASRPILASRHKASWTLDAGRQSFAPDIRRARFIALYVRVTHFPLTHAHARATLAGIIRYDCSAKSQGVSYSEISESLRKYITLIQRKLVVLLLSLSEIQTGTKALRKYYEKFLNL